MRDEDLIRLKHMRDAAEEALSFTRGKSRENLESDRQLVLSLIHLVEIIGEAATKVDKATREQYPQIQWPSIIAMRHRLVHAYYDVDLDQVWDTVENDLPTLLSQLQIVITSSGKEK